MKFKKVCKQQIEAIMDSFDFQKVKCIMEDTTWTWDQSVPNVDEIRRFAKNQLKEVSKNLKKGKIERYYISCGGFTSYGFVGFDDEEDKPFVHLVLHFGPSSCEDGVCFDHKEKNHGKK